MCDSEIPVSVGPSGSLILCQPQPPARRVPEQIPTVARIKELHGARRRTATDREYATKQESAYSQWLPWRIEWLAPKPSRLPPLRAIRVGRRFAGRQRRSGSVQPTTMAFPCCLDAPIEKCRAACHRASAVIFSLLGSGWVCRQECAVGQIPSRLNLHRAAATLRGRLPLTREVS